MFAVIQISGKQYKAAPKEELVIDRLKDDRGTSLEFDKILLIKDDKKILVGNPYVKKAKAKAKVLEHFKGEKIEIRRFKAKSRYRRKLGFRPQLTKILVESILY